MVILVALLAVLAPELKAVALTIGQPRKRTQAIAGHDSGMEWRLAPLTPLRTEQATNTYRGQQFITVTSPLAVPADWVILNQIGNQYLIQYVGAAKYRSRVRVLSFSPLSAGWAAESRAEDPRRLDFAGPPEALRQTIGSHVPRIAGRAWPFQQSTLISTVGDPEREVHNAQKSRDSKPSLDE
jgi:hypothetical protein